MHLKSLEVNITNLGTTELRDTRISMVEDFFYVTGYNKHCTERKSNLFYVAILVID